MIRQKNEAKALMEDLADAALMKRFCSDGVRSYEVPGQIIQNLSPEKRKVLEGLKVEDIANTRWTRPENINLEKMPRKLS
jgi:hypothetical protein